MNWRDLPPLSALRAFAAFAAEGTVQKAGAALNVSHAAISQQIRNLEAHMGLTLLDRSGRAARLTAEGRELAAALQEGFAGIAETVAGLTGADAARPLHVSTTASFAAHWLLPRLADFRGRHPDIDIMIDPNPGLVELTPGGVDVAIRYGTGPWPGLADEPLIASPLAIVAAPELIEGRVIDGPAALADLPWLSEFGRHESSAWLAKHGVTEATGGVTQMPGSMAIEGARQGQGVIATAYAWVEADLRSGRLQLLFCEEEDAGYRIVTRSGVARPPLAAFLKWLRGQRRDLT